MSLHVKAAPTNDRTHIEGATAGLARFAAQLRYTDIPQAAVARIKLCVLDALGCALFATSLPASRIVAHYVTTMGGCEGALAWGTGRRVPDGPRPSWPSGTHSIRRNHLFDP